MPYMFLLFLKSVIFFAFHITGAPPKTKQQEDKQSYLFELKMNSFNIPDSKAKTTELPQNPEKNEYIS